MVTTDGIDAYPKNGESDLGAVYSSEFTIYPELESMLIGFSDKLNALESFQETAVGQLEVVFGGFSRADRRRLGSPLRGERPAEYVYGNMASAAMGYTLYKRDGESADDESVLADVDNVGERTAMHLVPDSTIIAFPAMSGVRDVVETLGTQYEDHFTSILDDIDQIEDELANPEDGYELLKYFAFVKIDNDSLANVLTTAMIMGAETRKEGVLDGLISRYEDGEFNKDIVGETCHVLLDAGEADALDKDLKNMKDILILLRSCSDLETDDLIERLIDNFEQIPGNAKHEVSVLVGKISHSISVRIKKLTQVLSSINLSVDSAGDRMADMDRFDRTLGEIALKANIPDTSSGNPVEPKKRRKILVLTTRDQSAGTQEVAEKKKEPAKIYVRGSTEAIDPNDHKQFRESIGAKREDLMKLRGVEEDLRRAIQYLSKVDFSNGPVKGIIPARHTVTIKGESLEVYSFKPADVAGLSLPTKSGKKLRIFFSIVPDGFEIVEILQRDEVNSFYKNHGAGNARSKGHQK